VAEQSGEVRGKVCEQMDGELVMRYGPHVVATFEGGKEDKYAA
jgi:hypothetical protein